MKKTVSNLVIILVIIAGTFFMTRTYFPVENPILIRDTVKRDTGKTKYVDINHYFYRDTGHVDSIKIPLDSTELVAAYKKLYLDYNDTYSYLDTTRNDSLFFISIGSQITRNKPILYDLTYLDKTPSIIIKPTVDTYKNSIWAGLDIGADLIAPNIVYEMKKYNFGVGYNLQKGGGIVFKVGVKLK